MPEICGLRATEGFVLNAEKTVKREDCPSLEFPPRAVAVTKRNERERNRVRLVNEGFSCLRQKIPFANGKKRLSKVETLRYAVDYIRHLQCVIREYDERLSGDVIERQGGKAMLRLVSTRAQERWKMIRENGRKNGGTTPPLLRRHVCEGNTGGATTE